jgi:CDP-glycerol glycerophosphotransferase (TagB/SpsB family)
MSRADLYVADNTSTLYEFAATDRPVVVLSPPFYRRETYHGLRFWDHIPGIECSHTDHLEACIEEALIDTPSRKKQRRAAVEGAYGPQDGKATERAVEAIVSLLMEEAPEPVTPERTHKLSRSMRPFDFEGRTWRGGDTITHSQGLRMRDAGLIRGTGL